MKTTIKMLCSVCMILGFVFTSCKKGDKGDPGQQGPAGTNGNANVVGQTYTVTTWSTSSPSYYADIPVPAITQSIVDKGSVLVYLSNGVGGYSQLPLTYFPSSSYSETIEVVHNVGVIRIWITDSDLTMPLAPGTKVFKIVVIAGRKIKNMPYSLTSPLLSK